MSLSQLFLFFSLALIPLWTARLARTKGQNYWVWAGASIVLMFLPELFKSDLRMLGMVPILVLMFLKAPKSASEAEESAITCDRCQTAHTPGHNYCVNCGWELGTPYVEGVDDAPEKTPAPDGIPQPQTANVGSSSSPAVNESIPGDPVTGNVSPEDPPQEPASAPDLEHQPAQEAPPQPIVFSAPTPERMTERGASLAQQGRVQEAIDQFTKAIALDPDYKPALSNRAEAYEKSGRKAEAAEDLRRLEAI